jgi:multicomponent Na+:H+ antiporter subunit E
MLLLLWNLVLALMWAIATGQFNVANVVLGFALGYAVLWFTRRGHGLPSSRYFARVPEVLRFVAFYLWELLLANLRVAYDVATPKHHMRPGVIAIPIDAESDIEIATLANLITLTPGTLSLDLSPDRRVLYIHAMYIDGGQVDAFRRRIKQSLERRVLELLR